MYAIVFGKLDVVKLLLKQELLIYSAAKNLIEIPDDLVKGDNPNKKYYLFR